MVANRRFSLEPKAKFKGRIIGYRHLQCLLMSVGLCVLFSMRVNINVAVVAMMDNKHSNPDFPQYEWSQKVKSYIISSFFCGYVFLQVPAGGWSRRFGGQLLFLMDVMISSTLSLLTPLCVSVGGWPMLWAIRFFQGLLQGVTFPTIATLISKWAPIEERGTLQTLSITGSQIGVVLMMSMSGLICSSTWGWPGTFYLPGLVGLVWAAVWSIFAASTPRECKYISTDECAMIEESLGHDKQNNELSKTLAVPWKQILTSKHFLVLLVCNCSHHYFFWTLLSQIPSYVQSVLGKDIKSNALLSSLPFIVALLLMFILCPLAGLLEKSKLLNATVSRKIYNTIGHWTPVIPIIALSYLQPEQSNLAIGLLIIAVSFTIFCSFGIGLNHLDLSPNFAGTLMGIITSSSNVMSICAPLVVGFIVTDTKNVYQWRIVFLIAAAMIFAGNLIFLFFGTAKVQPWNEIQQPKTHEMSPLNETIAKITNVKDEKSENLNGFECDSV